MRIHVMFRSPDGVSKQVEDYADALKQKLLDMDELVKG